MKVTEYFLGFGPRLWSVRKGETEYGVKAIPAGGYVRIIGMSNLEEIDPVDEPRTYRQQSYPRRLSVAVAGLDDALHHRLRPAVRPRRPAWACPRPTTDRSARSRSSRRAEPGAAGGAPARVTVSCRSTACRLADWDDCRRATCGAPGQGRSASSSSATARRSRSPSCRAPTNPDGERVGFIGIAPDIDHKRVARSAGSAGRCRGIGNGTVLTVKALGRSSRPHGCRATPTRSWASDQAERLDREQQRPARLGGRRHPCRRPAAEDHRFSELLLLLVGINIFVGIFNMVPLLPLDGGHVAIAVYERLRSRAGRRYHADVAKLLPLTSAVVVVLVVFGVAVIYLDIVHPISTSNSGDVPAPEDPQIVLRHPRTRWPSAATRR